ncbi:PadR family transcriptional regulator [Actinomycetospora sp. NBRC 106375]|uniref:PadR family transcriptional regulator n=1 Tax=Actinomycetospora sp. NBRC 106375 TaxID=3032207 RepID=UPI0024A352C0|nr:PadR family transcriptional regulator [Actinomycetospora sp. NBRC 106375]GLZ45741.1 PadR family transcriptional regulator [Actinomycetospora sp. NBRC 106375]
MLELAVLGLLHEAPMHGYQLRKQLHARLGTFRAFSWGSLYPTLRRLQRAGLIAETTDAPKGEGTDEGAETAAPPRSTWSTKTRRGRRVFELTAEGKDRFDELVAEAGPQTWDDESFGIHLAFFSRTPVEVRMRILEGRRRRVEERREGLRSTLSRAGEQIDHYTRELHRIGLESTEREVRWLNELIAAERGETQPSPEDTADETPSPDSPRGA